MSPSGYAAEPDKVAWQRATRDDPKRRWAFARDIIARKLRATLDVLREHVPTSRFSKQAESEIAGLIERINHHPPDTINELLGVEGPAANAYFRAWRALDIKWRDTSRRPIPDDWRKFTSRSSLANPKTARNVRATHPVNAILNYAYGALFKRVAVQAIADGYDPTIGIMHASKKHERDRVHAFALDLMEPERPRVDAAVLAFVRGTAFSGADFTLRDDGVCRLNPELARRVVQHVDAATTPKAPHVAAAKPRVARKSAARKHA